MVDRSLALHTAATGVAALLVTGAFAGVAGALLTPWLGVSPFVIALPVLVVAVAAQVWYVRRDVLGDDARLVDEETYPDLHARLSRLARALDAPTPRLAVVDADTPNSCSLSGGGRGTVVVSTGLLDACDDDELDAVLAHELAHLQNHDAAVLTVAAFLPAVVNGDYSLWRDLGLNEVSGAGPTLALVGGILLYALATPSLPGAPLSLTSLGAFLALVLAMVLLGGVLLGVAATPVVFLARSLSRTREFAADRAAARLTGSPATLATLLERLGDADDRPETDARQDAGLHGLCLLPGGFGKGVRHGDTRAKPTEHDGLNGFRVETRAHPSVADRVSRLRALTADVERGDA
ncbi:M48 family metalloprotease [Halobaculum limi]|uniref:M48 family metalloprotease n=1 Tax=Halobaculum limi TaxID=3031916 RepID=UPI002406CCE7|nr:M48 family metalloprotease [Halobaculum sp. YSMS11]